MNNFQHYIGKEAIYLEKGCVLQVRLITVDPLEADGNIGADFQLCILSSHGRRLAPVEAETDASSENDLWVGSVFLEDHNEIITASGYISWKLIFNADLIENILLAINNNRNEVSPYRLAQGVCAMQERD